MSKTIDTCPVCGKRSLQALGDVVAFYNIWNRDASGEGGQLMEFDRLSNDEPYNVFEIKCKECNAYWEEGAFELDDFVLLVALDDQDADELATELNLKIGPCPEEESSRGL